MQDAAIAITVFVARLKLRLSPIAERSRLNLYLCSAELFPVRVQDERTIYISP